MFTITDLCPVCHKALQVTRTSFFCCRTIKACPDGHYVEELHPLLDTMILYQQKKE